MKAKDSFGVVVRSLGLLLLLYSLWYCSFATAYLSGAPEPAPGDTASYLAFGLPGFVVSVVLLRFARHIVRFSYPDDKDDSDATPKA